MRLCDYASVMNVSDMADEQILKELARMLTSSLIPVQKRIAADLEVDQPFISNARLGKLRRVTPRVIALFEYARVRIASGAAAEAAAAGIEAELATDGEPTSRRRLRHRAAPYEADALAGVKAYLRDGYDPRLIVEQLAVLRRAQRVRRPGRAPLENRGRAD
jgi:hypothetical protein